MTVGENIRRIRQERNLTQRQLGEMVGASEAYIRAYESGRRNPKPSSLEKIADALSVNPEVLENSDFDGIKAIHRLFQIFRQYDGQLFEYQDKDGNDMVGISFGTLSLMRSWFDRYEEYMVEVEKCNEKRLGDKIYGSSFARFFSSAGVEGSQRTGKCMYIKAWQNQGLQMLTT